jgi:uncharacterized protein (UPF0332 family)
MTCSPETLLEAAKSVKAIATDEAMYRAVANRAYYASYHCCRLYNATLPIASTQGSGVHEQLINHLTFPSAKLTKNGKARATAIGKYLRVICSARVAADYSLDEPFSEIMMETCMEAATVIFSGVKVKTGLIEE